MGEFLDPNGFSIRTDCYYLVRSDLIPIHEDRHFLTEGAASHAAVGYLSTLWNSDAYGSFPEYRHPIGWKHMSPYANVVAGHDLYEFYKARKATIVTTNSAGGEV